MVTVRESAIHGRGLFARRRIDKDTLIGFYVGWRTQEDGPHVLWIHGEDDESYGIDGICELRYTNHSPLPNAVFLGDELWALETIEAGSEITFHYGEEWDEEAEVDEESERDWEPALLTS